MFRKLREDGVGATTKHAAVVSPEEEELLWSTKTIGDHDPLSIAEGSVLLYRQGVLPPWRGGTKVA